MPAAGAAVVSAPVVPAASVAGVVAAAGFLTGGVITSAAIIIMESLNGTCGVDQRLAIGKASLRVRPAPQPVAS